VAFPNLKWNDPGATEPTGPSERGPPALCRRLSGSDYFCCRMAGVERTVFSMTENSVGEAEIVAGDIMSSPCVACREEAYFEEIAELLADREISGAPVVDKEGRVVGVISERDVAHALGGPLIRLAIRRPVRSGPFLREPHSVPLGAHMAKDIMTSPPETASPETPMRTLAKKMVKTQINRIPIVRAGRLVGVVTRGDILRAISGLSSREVEQPPVIIGSGVVNSRL